MIDLTPIFQAIIALLAALVTYKLIPWIKSRTTERQQQNLFVAAKIAVMAAEQLYKNLSTYGNFPDDLLSCPPPLPVLLLPVPV